MLERTDFIKDEVLKPVTFVLAYPTVYNYFLGAVSLMPRFLFT